MHIAWGNMKNTIDVILPSYLLVSLSSFMTSASVVEAFGGGAAWEVVAATSAAAANAAAAVAAGFAACPSRLAGAPIEKHHNHMALSDQPHYCQSSSIMCPTHVSHAVE